jgi:hypothetical protein
MVVILGLELLVGAIMVVAVGGGSTMICGPSFFALGTILLVGVAPCLAPLEIFSCVGGLGDALVVVAVGEGSTIRCGSSFFALATILLVGVAPCLAPLEIVSCVGGLGDVIVVVALGFVDTIWLVLLFFVALAASCRGSRLLASSPCLGGCRRRSLVGVGRW